VSYLPNNLAADTVVSLTRVQQNDAALDTAISGNLTQANLSSATQIPNSMLANSTVEEIITLEWNNGVAVGAAAPILPAASTTVPLQFKRVGGSGTYTVQSASYSYTVLTTGTVNGSISVRLGTVAANVWATSATMVSTTTMNGTVTAGQSAVGDLSLSTSSFTAPLSIALMPEGVGTTSVIRMSITIRLTRALQ
jgi:hypothetical protein